VKVLKSASFGYKLREDRILATINAGTPEAWACWLTRRLVLALLARGAEFLASTSPLAKRAPSEARGELAAFERDTAMAKTAPSMTYGPADVLSPPSIEAELAKRLTISNLGDNMRLELHGEGGGGAVGVMARAELQRILQMLQIEVNRGAWLAAPAGAAPAPAAAAAPTAGRH
jgi:hypothetical protein